MFASESIRRLIIAGQPSLATYRCLGYLMLFDLIMFIVVAVIGVMLLRE